MQPTPPEPIPDEEDAFLRRFAFSVEDMIEHRLPPQEWYRGYRFFRSPNVVDLFKILQKRGGLHGRFKP
jgi:hypothetical protein